jgi:hypothetical protein
MTWISDADERKKLQEGEITTKRKAKPPLNSKLNDILFQQELNHYLPTINLALNQIREEGGLKVLKIYPQEPFDPNKTQFVVTNKLSVIWKIWIPNHHSGSLYLTYENKQVRLWCRINGENRLRKTTLKEVTQENIVTQVHRWFNCVYK